MIVVSDYRGHRIEVTAAADKLATLAAMEAGTRTGTAGTVTELRPAKAIAK